jgi:tetraacyldisaccharide 4'-kinase
MNSFLAPLAAGYRMGAALRVRAYGQGWLKSQRLGRPVISVGNLSAGGTGKTPLVIHVARILIARGLRPCILTRGYGRAVSSDLTVISPGAESRADVREAGDEPVLISRAVSGAPILISADRVRAGRLAEERFRIDAHILDDGFQHLALQRDLDIVLIDVTQEFRAGAVLPAGLLREPPSALARADMILLTRSELGDPAAVEAEVRTLNPGALVLRCSTKLEGFVNLLDGEFRPASEILDKPMMAFCGIGNPRAFFSDLRKWGAKVVTEQSYPDHHFYSPRDVSRILARFKRSGATALVTTEKDALKLPASQGLRDSAEVLVCKIQLEISEAAEFEAVISRLISGGRSAA